jgi:hypothetical protein
MPNPGSSFRGAWVGHFCVRTLGNWGSRSKEYSLAAGPRVQRTRRNNNGGYRIGRSLQFIKYYQKKNDVFEHGVKGGLVPVSAQPLFQ